MLSMAWALGGVTSRLGLRCVIWSSVCGAAKRKGVPPSPAPAPDKKKVQKALLLVLLGHQLAGLTLISFFSYFCRECDQRAGLRGDDADRLRSDGHQDPPHQKFICPSIPPRAAQKSH